MTNYMQQKLYKQSWRYQLHDDFGCIREFKNKDDALYWQSKRQELKLKVIKPPKFKPNFEVTDNFDPYDIPF